MPTIHQIQFLLLIRLFGRPSGLLRVEMPQEIVDAYCRVGGWGVQVVGQECAAVDGMWEDYAGMVQSNLVPRTGDVALWCECIPTEASWMLIKYAREARAVLQHVATTVSAANIRSLTEGELSLLTDCLGPGAWCVGIPVRLQDARSMSEVHHIETPVRYNSGVD